MVLWFFYGCTPWIHAQYQERATQVLAPAGPAGEDWNPDIRLRFSRDALRELSEESISQGLLSRKGKTITLDPPVGPTLKLKPRMRVTELELRSSPDSCEDCLDLAMQLEGGARWELGERSGKIALQANAQARAHLEIEALDEDQWSMELGELELLEVEVDAGLIRHIDLAPLLQGWVERAVEAAPPVSLGKLGGDELPIRAVRVQSGSQSLEVEALSDLSGGGELPRRAGSLDTDWELQLSQQTLAVMLRRSAFESGPMSLDIALDPESLALQGDQFMMDLRLWRLRRMGWWRDYQVLGSIALTDEELRLEASEVSSQGKSRFAGLVDPLALIAERQILGAIEDGIEQAVPLGQSTRVRELEIHALTENIKAADEVLKVQGALKIEATD